MVSRSNNEPQVIAALLAYLREGWTIHGFARIMGADCWRLEKEYELSKFVPLPPGWVKPQ